MSVAAIGNTSGTDTPCLRQAAVRSGLRWFRTGPCPVAVSQPLNQIKKYGVSASDLITGLFSACSTVASMKSVRCCKRSEADMISFTSEQNYYIYPEQMMRHFKRTLKNCLNIGSERSAKNVAFMFSVVESCAMNAISPVVYIKDLLVKFTDENISNQTLLPCYYAKVC
jgi:uncharacterized membrane protein